MNNKINLFISSKNRQNNETSSKFSVILPDSLLKVDETEYFTLSINGFNIFNQWYNIREGYNSFQIITVNDDVSTIVNYTIPEGNYNALQLRDYLNSLFTNTIAITYNKMRNTYTFTNLTTNQIFLNIINCGDILGFNIVETYIEITTLGTESQKPINLISDNVINLSITGDIEFKYNNLHNFRNSTFEPSNIIFQKFITDPPFYNTNYKNDDSGTNFKYELNNRDSINYFTLQVFNQDLQYINNFPDYMVSLQFEKHQKDESIDILGTIRDYIKLIFEMLGLALENYKIL